MSLNNFDTYISENEIYFAEFQYTFNVGYNIIDGELYDSLGTKIFLEVFERKGEKFLSDDFLKIMVNAQDELKKLFLTQNNNVDKLKTYVTRKLYNLENNRDVISKVIDAVNSEIQHNSTIKDKTLLDKRIYNSATSNILEFICWFNEMIEPLNLIKPHIENQKTDESDTIKDKPFQSDIFKNEKVFKFFNTYCERHIIDYYLDYSYIFQQLLDEEHIYKTTHKRFMDWLSENNYIDGKTHSDFLIKKNFVSLRKSSSTQRLNNYINLKDSLFI